MNNMSCLDHYLEWYFSWYYNSLVDIYSRKNADSTVPEWQCVEYKICNIYEHRTANLQK